MAGEAEREGCTMSAPVFVEAKHTRGRHACGKTGLLVRSTLKPGDVLLPKFFRHINGEPFHGGEMFRCGACDHIAQPRCSGDGYYLESSP